MNKIGKEIAWIGLYIVVFILIQLVIQFAFAGGYLVYYKMPLANLRNLLMSNVTLTIASTIVSSLITIFVFLKKGWASHSRDYLASRPWATLLWVVVAAIGIIIPSMGLGELFKVDMPGELQMMFVRMMHNPFGYVAIGVIVPFAEEIVFRGAILRRLLRLFDGKPWAAILISAIIFGLVHGNSAQFLNASLLGILLGWMFYRTGSIIPGFVLHWVNNTVVYVVANLMPGFEDASLSQLSNGRPIIIALYIVFSLCILMPALVQLNMRMGENRGK